MDHVFFILVFVDGHLGCFCVLAIVNSAAVNTGGGGSVYLFEFCFSLDICSVVGRGQDHVVALFFDF